MAGEAGDNSGRICKIAVNRKTAPFPPSAVTEASIEAQLASNLGHPSKAQPHWLGQNVFDDVRLFNAGEADVEAAEGEREALVVDAEAVQHGGMQVAEVDGIFGDVVAEIVGAAVF